jgi:hypothetical protein
MKSVIVALIALCAVLIAGCDAKSIRTTVDADKITYVQDERTSLCFAVLGRGRPVVGVAASSFSMTNVPCTKEVLALAR